MKTLREYIDQLDEIDRRGFLKGMGAAAVAGATGGLPKDAKADWHQPIQLVDPMTDKKSTIYRNRSNDNTAEIFLRHTSRGYNLVELAMSKDSLRKPAGSSMIWVDPATGDEISRSDQTYSPGRLRTDNNQPIFIRFAFPYDSNKTTVLLPAENAYSSLPEGGLASVIAGAKQRILIDISQISNRDILQFNVQQNESVEEGWKGAVAGGLAGHALGGPGGAAIGAVAGDWLGNKMAKQNEKTNRAHPAYKDGIKAQQDGWNQHENAYSDKDSSWHQAYKAWDQGWIDSKKNIAQDWLTEKELEEASPDAVKRIEQLVRYK
jgi:hypothetical protein